MTDEEAFIKFVKERELKDRYFISSIFEFDYKKDQVNFDKVDECSNTFETYYLTGAELYQAFKAGVAHGSNKFELLYERERKARKRI